MWGGGPGWLMLRGRAGLRPGGCAQIPTRTFHVDGPTGGRGFGPCFQSLEWFALQGRVCAPHTRPTVYPPPVPAWAHALPAGRALASTPQGHHQAVVLEGPWPAPLAGGDRVFSFPGAGWGVGGGQGPVLSGLAGGRGRRRGAGLHNGPRLAGGGVCSPTWERLTRPSREAASHASWRLALGTACQRQLCSQPPPHTHSWHSGCPGGPHRPPQVPGGGKDVVARSWGAQGTTEGHGGPCLGEGVRGAGPLFRLQEPPPKSASPLSARPLRSPVSRISGAAQWGLLLNPPPRTDASQ